MKDTKNTPKDNKLNPEIPKKAKELFRLIEEQYIKDGKSTESSVTMMEEMGEMLRSHRGMLELFWAYDMSLTASQSKKNDLEEATWSMTNQALSILNDLSRNTLEIIEVLNKERPFHHLEHRMKDAKEAAEDVYLLAGLEFESRAKAYHEEIKELKEAS